MESDCAFPAISTDAEGGNKVTISFAGAYSTGYFCSCQGK